MPALEEPPTTPEGEGVIAESDGAPFPTPPPDDEKGPPPAPPLFALGVDEADAGEDIKPVAPPCLSTLLSGRCTAS